MSYAKDVVGYILLIILPIMEISCYFVIRLQQNNILMRKRTTALVYISTIGSWMAILNLTIALPSIVRIPYPSACGIYYIIHILVPFVSLAPQLFRGIDLWARLKRNRLIVEFGETAHIRRRDVETAGIGGRLHTLDEEDSIRSNTPINQDDAISTGTSEKHDREEAISDKHSSYGSLGGRKSSLTREKAKLVKRQKIAALQITAAILILVPIIITVKLFKLSSTIPLEETQLEECVPTKGTDVADELKLTLGTAWVLILFTILVWFTLGTIFEISDDGLGIRQELNRNIAILFLTNSSMLILGSQDEEGLWQVNIIALQQLLLSFSTFIMPRYFPTFTQLLVWIQERSGLKAPTYGKHIPQPTRRTRTSLIKLGLGPDLCTKHQADATISLDAGLCVLLSSSNGKDAFTEHCAKEFSVENIRFWNVVNDFHKAVDMLTATRVSKKDENDAADIQAFAEDIFNTYVKVGSELQINISSDQFKAIEAKINKQQTTDRSLFDNAQDEVFRVMSRHSYPRFLATQNEAARPSIFQLAQRRLSSGVTPVNGGYNNSAV